MREATDDAGGGRRGLRAKPSPTLFKVLEEQYGIAGATTCQDLGGSSNLNLLVHEGGRSLVVRVYRPSVTVDRLSDIQRARRRLAEAGLPCLAPITTTHGQDWARLGPRLLEVEEYVENDGRMNTMARIESGLRLLGRMHNVLTTVDTSPASEAPMFVNYVAPEDVVTATSRGAQRMRAWGDTPKESRLADAAEELASFVDDVQKQLGAAWVRPQLVHGDFWDNNVLYQGGDIVLVHDFDHMGHRARIDDLALTAYFMLSEPTVRRDARLAAFRRMVDAYDSGLDDHLTAGERAALPVALARQPLWSVGRWIAELDDDRAARAHANGLGSSIDSALEIMRDLRQWQAAVA